MYLITDCSVAIVVYLSTGGFLQEWLCMSVGCSELMFFIPSGSDFTFSLAPAVLYYCPLSALFSNNMFSSSCNRFLSMPSLVFPPEERFSICFCRFLCYKCSRIQWAESCHPVSPSLPQPPTLVQLLMLMAAREPISGSIHFSSLFLSWISGGKTPLNSLIVFIPPVLSSESPLRKEY